MTGDELDRRSSQFMHKDDMNCSDASVLVSVVTPVYRGAAFLPELVQALENERDRWRALQSRVILSEVIFVLDAPVDESAEICHALSMDRPWLRIVELSKNYGQHSATVAGILHSSGDWVVTLDEDLQHDPGRIPELLEAAVAHRSDIVYALPTGRVHGGWRDRLSRWVKRAVARLAGDANISKFNSFRLVRGDLARAASSICAQHTYFDLALTWYSDRMRSVSLDLVDPRQATAGSSGYSFWTLVRHGKRLLLTSDFHVLRFTFTAAALAVVTATGYGAWILYRRLFSDWGYDVAGWPSLALMILVFGAAAVFLLGLLLEFSQAVMLQLQGKPAFFVIDRSKDALLAEEVPRLMSDAGSHK
jgi:glycosyltransferase involved in cell wall biosynthesis